MDWLFAQQIRPFIKVAAQASLLLNLALLAPALYMLQVFDRVFASGSIETLVMLSVPLLIMLVLGYYMDAARARTLAAAGRRVEACLAPAALGNALQQAAGGMRHDQEALRDVAQLRTLLASPGVVALFDAPWVTIYLLIITLMHPLLGGIAALGALLAVRPGRVHRIRHPQAHRAGAGSGARVASAGGTADAQRRIGGRHGHDHDRASPPGRSVATNNTRRRSSSPLSAQGWARWRACRARDCRRWRSDSVPGW